MIVFLLLLMHTDRNDNDNTNDFEIHTNRNYQDNSSNGAEIEKEVVAS